ncbi:MAG: hypothetical protein EBX02_11405 [Betaproteobacteria bacterium]|nr:hypothetical protein [Betaproteobacteria bacterium]
MLINQRAMFRQPAENGLVPGRQHSLFGLFLAPSNTQRASQWLYSVANPQQRLRQAQNPQPLGSTLIKTVAPPVCGGKVNAALSSNTSKKIRASKASRYSLSGSSRISTVNA